MNLRGIRWMLACGGQLMLVGATCAAGPPLVMPERPNQPPSFTDSRTEIEVRAGSSVSHEFRATDPDGDPLTFTVSALPEGARLEWNPQEVRRQSDGIVLRYWTPELSWAPTESNVGGYDVTVTASDGHHTVEKTVKIYVEEQWETFLMPGLNFTTWIPTGRRELGSWYGPGAEFLLAAWIHRNQNRGPSHVRIYAGLGLLGSTVQDLPKAVNINFGFDLSIERNPVRRALIPYYGLESGVLINSEFGRPGYFTPLVGIHVWSDRNFFVNLSGGYLFPTQDVDKLRGWQLKLAVNFSLW